MLTPKFFCPRHIATMLLSCLILFTACKDPSNNYPPNNDYPPKEPDNPTGNTWVEFKNLEEFLVIIYNDPARQVVFAEIPATGTKKVSADPASAGRAFYPTFNLMYPIGTTGTITIPYDGPAITAAIVADKTNAVSIPKLGSIIINSAYIMLINNSSFSLTFNEGPLEKSPLGGGPGIINSGLNAAYEITPGSVSTYSVLRNGLTPVAFPADLSEFKAGIIYVLTYNGTALTVTSQLPINSEITVPGNNLAMKLAWLQSNILSNKSYFIEITADENIVPQSLSYSSKSGITIILNGIGTMRTVNLSSSGDLFTIGSGVTLILDNNITLKGRSDNGGSLVYIEGGRLVMNVGAKITGNSNRNSGGGVRVSSGTFTMNGGEIYGNTTTYNAGGVFVSSGTFTMNGGEISNNTSSGGYVDGGGVYVSSGTFTMNGGKISNNNTNGYGGGVYVDGSSTFNMKDGEISGNIADYGGGVYTNYYRSSTDYKYYYGTFRMGGGVIYGNNAVASLNNTASYGAALLNKGTTQYGTFVGDTFNSSGNLFTTDTTIRVVNGNLLTE